MLIVRDRPRADPKHRNKQIFNALCVPPDTVIPWRATLEIAHPVSAGKPQHAPRRVGERRVRNRNLRCPVPLLALDLLRPASGQERTQAKASESDWQGNHGAPVGSAAWRVTAGEGGTH